MGNERLHFRGSGRMADELDHEPHAVRFGNTGRNLIRGPGLFNLDGSIFRTFKMTERFDLQFRAECFNLVNHPQFAAPNTSFGTAQFGQVSAQQNLPRLVQLSLRLRF